VVSDALMPTNRPSFHEPFDPPAPHELPQTHPLASAWAKYDRAIQHFLSLSAAAREVIAASSESGTIEPVRIDPNRIHVHFRLPSVPLAIACMVGDVLHCLRASLDHAAWFLALPDVRAKKWWTVQFPIVSTQDKFDRDAVARMFGPAVAILLETLQPFNDRPELLWLRDLDIVDKHEAVVVVRHRLHILSITITDAAGERPLIPHGDPSSVPIDIEDGGYLTLKHGGERGLPGVRVHAQIANTFMLKGARSWPGDLVNRILRRCLFDAEETLQTLTDHVQRDAGHK
jgi:hypothetical protein